MELKDFKFPKLTNADIAFSTLDTDHELLKEAKERGFYDNDNGEYNKLFSTLFFNGGKVKFKENVDETLIESAWPYVRAFMSSFSPKHEEKAAICAMLLSEIVEPKVTE